MEVSAKELRGSPGKYIEQAARGNDVVITMRGKRVARLVPYVESAETTAEAAVYSHKDEVFGLWTDRTDVADVVVDRKIEALVAGRDRFLGRG